MHATGAYRKARTSRFNPLFRAALLTLTGVALVLSGPAGFPVHAFQFESGPITGSLDTTITVGTDLRMAERSPDLVGFPSGGRQFSINADDGNQNFNFGEPVTGGFRVTHELDARWRNFGFFGRMYYFYDWAIMAKERRYPLSDAARSYSGRNIKLMDAYLTADFYPFDRPLTIRLGNQVLNWGESTFIQFGINVINPVDVSKLRAAGSELRDALLPVPMINVSTDITRNLSIEGFYQFHWQPTEPEPTGTFFSTTDVGGPGGRYAWLGFGMPPGQDNPPSEVFSNPPSGTHTYRLDDLKPSHMGQGGVALRYFSPTLNQTEFGLYFINYHSRMPYVSVRSGEDPGGGYPEDPADILNWIPDYVDTLLYAQSYGDYYSTMGVHRDYPENIHVVGASFNTSIWWGMALQGEVSYRPNMPLQMHQVEVLFAGISPFDPYVNALMAFTGDKPDFDPDFPLTGRSQVLRESGPVGFEQLVRGWKRKQVLQPQVTLTKAFGPMFRLLDQLFVVGEVGAMWVMDMEKKSVLRYDAPGTFTSGNEWFTNNEFFRAQPATTVSGFATPFSWGYRLAARGDIFNAIGPVNLQPTFAFFHDVHGTSPSPTVSFLEGRMSTTVGIAADYLNRYRLRIAYTNFFSTKGNRNRATKETVLRYYDEMKDIGGLRYSTMPRNLTLEADKYNDLLHDRDFLSIAFSYYF